MSRISAFIEGSVPPREDTGKGSLPSVSQEVGPPQAQSAGALILDFSSASRAVTSKCLLFISTQSLIVRCSSPHGLIQVSY